MNSSYSIIDAINALSTGSWNQIPSVESRASDELMDKTGSTGLGRAMAPGSLFATRAVPLTVSGAGSDLTQTANNGFFGSLQAMSTVARLGAQFLTLDQNTTRTPVVATASAPTWQSAEAVNVAESNLSLALRTYVPHHCPITLILSGQLLRQGKNVVQYVTTEILREAAAELDRVCIQGDGTAGRPIGIVNTSGITSASGTALTYAGIVAGQQGPSDANAVLDVNSLGFIATPSVAAAMKQRQGATTSEALWTGALASGTIDKLPAFATKNCPTGDLIFGDFSNLIIAAWGDNVSFDADPFTGFQSNLVTLRLWLTLDIQLRSPLGFTVFTGVS